LARSWGYPALLLGLFFGLAFAAILSWPAKPIAPVAPGPAPVQPVNSPVPAGQQQAPAIAPPPAVQTPVVAHTPEPEVRRAEPVPAPRAELVPVPRAELVPVTVKRATLQRLPSQELGVYKWYPLPLEWGGGIVKARYMGTVEQFSQIPADPVPGDMWNVIEGNASWIYCTPAGYDHAIWIDP
jgi:hypothetical protein